MIHRLTLATFLIAVGVLAGSSANAQVVARFDCRSFGQTASSGGSLNIKYATPMMCWASKSTVNGVAVNENGWVPEVFFDWDWDDTSLGSVTRGGVSMDLGKSVGVVAAHAFKPSGYADSCGGGTNSLHTVRLTVSGVVSGQRQSASTTMNVCVENPRTTWPRPVAFCDDSNCADDAGLPPGVVHGGNRPDLGGILSWCETHGSSRVMLEGGVTFSTASTRISVGGASCLVESYGSGRAKLAFTGGGSSSAILANDSACAGFRLHNVTLAGSGSGPRLISGDTNTGCYEILDSNVSNTPGEEFSAMSIVDPGGSTLQSEGYYIKFNYTRQSDSGLPANYIFGNYTAFVGGEISGIDTAPQNNEHNIRLPQWRHVVIDSMLLADQESGRHLITLRQDCGGTSSCPNNANAAMFSISRNELRADDAGTVPVTICTSGSGSAEQTKCYDGDIIRNLGSWDAINTKRELILVAAGTAGSQTARFRVIQNAVDLSTQDSSTHERLITFENTQNVAVIGNVVTALNRPQQNFSIANVSSGVVKNNVCYENGPGRCDPFPSLSGGLNNLLFTSDPFDGDAGEPATGPGFKFSELKITSASPLANVGSIDPVPTDVSGATRAGATDVGLWEAGGTGGGGTTPPPPAAPAAPVLL